MECYAGENQREARWGNRGKMFLLKICVYSFVIDESIVLLIRFEGIMIETHGF